MGRTFSASYVDVSFKALGRAGKHGTAGHQFKATYRSTLSMLRTETGLLGAQEIIVAVAADASQIRQDGQMRADARVDADEIEVFLPESNVGPLRYSCSRFMRRWAGELPGWQANLRAVALGMEALRKIERYGLGSGTEQYAGFGALPPGDPIALGAAMTVEEAAWFIAQHSVEEGSGPETWWAEVQADPSFALALFKDAAKVHHPDQGGDPAVFRRLIQARDLLRETFPDAV